MFFPSWRAFLLDTPAFLPQSKDMQVRGTGELAVGVMLVCLYGNKHFSGDLVRTTTFFNNKLFDKEKNI